MSSNLPPGCNERDIPGYDDLISCRECGEDVGFGETCEGCGTYQATEEEMETDARYEFHEDY